MSASRRFETFAEDLRFDRTFHQLCFCSGNKIEEWGPRGAITDFLKLARNNLHHMVLKLGAGVFGITAVMMVKPVTRIGQDFAKMANNWMSSQVWFTLLTGN